MDKVESLVPLFKGTKVVVVASENPLVLDAVPLSCRESWVQALQVLLEELGKYGVNGLPDDRRPNGLRLWMRRAIFELNDQARGDLVLAPHVVVYLYAMLHGMRVMEVTSWLGSVAVERLLTGKVCLQIHNPPPTVPKINPTQVAGVMVVRPDAGGAGWGGVSP